MNENDLKKRTKQFGLRVIRLVESLPGTSTARTIGNQLLQEAEIVPAEKLKDLMKEADELVAIFTASIKTARAHLRS